MGTSFEFDPSFLLLALLPLATQLKEECVVRLLTDDAPTMREYAHFHHLPGRALRLPDVCVYVPCESV